jgi:hypothetical protein
MHSSVQLLHTGNRKEAMLIPLLTAALLAGAPAEATEVREPVPQVSAVHSSRVAAPEVILELRQVPSAAAAPAQDVVREQPAIRTLVVIVLLAVAVGALIVVAL